MCCETSQVREKGRHISYQTQRDAGLCVIYFDGAPFQRNRWHFTSATGAFYEKRRPDARVTFTVPLERRAGFVQEVGSGDPPAEQPKHFPQAQSRSPRPSVHHTFAPRLIYIRKLHQQPLISTYLSPLERQITAGTSFSGPISNAHTCTNTYLCAGTLQMTMIKPLVHMNIA